MKQKSLYGATSLTTSWRIYFTSFLIQVNYVNQSQCISGAWKWKEQVKDRTSSTLYWGIGSHKRLYLIKYSLGVLQTMNISMAAYQQFARLQLQRGLNLPTSFYSSYFTEAFFFSMVDFNNWINFQFAESIMKRTVPSKQFQNGHRENK